MVLAWDIKLHLPHGDATAYKHRYSRIYTEFFFSVSVFFSSLVAKYRLLATLYSTVQKSFPRKRSSPCRWSNQPRQFSILLKKLLANPHIARGEFFFRTRETFRSADVRDVALLIAMYIAKNSLCTFGCIILRPSHVWCVFLQLLLRSVIVCVQYNDAFLSGRWIHDGIWAGNAGGPLHSGDSQQSRYQSQHQCGEEVSFN